MRTSPATQRGFTLIEVVVAFVLMTLIFSVGFEIFSSGLARAGGLEERSRALEVARSRLADAGMEDVIAQGQSQGDSADPRFHWTTTVTPYDETAEPGHAPTDAMHPFKTAYSLYRVDVQVEWHGGDGKDHSLALATLRLGPRPR